MFLKNRNIISKIKRSIVTDYAALNQFEFRKDSITDFGVSCHWASEKSMNTVVTTSAPSFLIRSSSIKSRMGSKFGQFGIWAMKFAALERLENPLRLLMGEML